jgi:hypothetical protein
LQNSHVLNSPWSLTTSSYATKLKKRCLAKNYKITANSKWTYKQDSQTKVGLPPPETRFVSTLLEEKLNPFDFSFGLKIFKAQKELTLKI